MGPFLDDLIESYLFGLLPIAAALFTGTVHALGGVTKKKDRG